MSKTQHTPGPITFDQWLKEHPMPQTKSFTSHEWEADQYDHWMEATAKGAFETAAERDRLKEENESILLEHGRISDELAILGSKYWEISRGLEGVSKLVDFWEKECDKEKALNAELLEALDTLLQFASRANYDSLVGDGEEREGKLEAIHGTIMQAQAVIRKAKGE